MTGDSLTLRLFKTSTPLAQCHIHMFHSRYDVHNKNFTLTFHTSHNIRHSQTYSKALQVYPMKRTRYMLDRLAAWPSRVLSQDMTASATRLESTCLKHFPHSELACLKNCKFPNVTWVCQKYPDFFKVICACLKPSNSQNELGNEESRPPASGLWSRPAASRPSMPASGAWPLASDLRPPASGLRSPAFAWKPSVAKVHCQSPLPS